MAPVKRTFPGFTWRMVRGEGVEWTGELQPTPESRRYKIRLLHEPERPPRVWVLSPPLRPDSVHRYRDQSLCLYWPKQWRWSASESLAATIIPWAALWLYFYELWLVTGEWLGPSSPHTPGAKKEAA